MFSYFSFVIQSSSTKWMNNVSFLKIWKNSFNEKMSSSSILWFGPKTLWNNDSLTFSDMFSLCLSYCLRLYKVNSVVVWFCWFCLILLLFLKKTIASKKVENRTYCPCTLYIDWKHKETHSRMHSGKLWEMLVPCCFHWQTA